VTTQSWADVTITYYTVQLAVTKLQTHVTAALNRFSERIGPYPYSSYAVAEVPTGPSMESPGMIWINKHTAARGTLRYAAVHETAHQWFYGTVGNDQAAEPFADESLAEFLTRDLIGHRGSQCAESVLDMRVYDYSKECYYETIYIQGDLYLEAYRQQVGDAQFWAGVRQYYDEYRFKLGGTHELLETLDNAAQGAGGGHDTRFPSLYPGVGS
jgi:aminopeptidase N